MATTTTTTTFAGTNQRSLAQFLNSQNSDCQFINNPKNGHIFCLLTGTGQEVSMSENAQQKILEPDAALADFNVVDMPGKDQQTGLPDGTVFTLIVCQSQNNVVKSFTR